MSSKTEVVPYLTQIQHLEDQLEDWRPKQEELEKDYNELASQLALLEEDSRIQNGHVKYVLTAHEKKVSEMLDQLENKHQDAKRHRVDLKLQHSEEMQELRQLIEKLTSEEEMEAKKLEEQEKDLISVKLRVSAMESPRRQLDKQKEEHDIATNIMKVAARVELDRKVERMQSFVEPTVKVKTERILKTNRAEHKQRLKQLHFLKCEMVPLKEDVDAMQGRQKDLYSEQDELENDFIKLIKQKFILKKKVNELTEQWQQLTSELKDCTLAKQRKLAETDALSKPLPYLAELSTRITSLRFMIQKERCKNLKLESVKQETSIVVRHVMSDPDMSSENESTVQRLVETLDSSALL